MITKELLQDYFHADFVSIDSLINDVLIPIFGEVKPGYTEVTASETLRDKAHDANIQRIKHAATLSADGFEINVFDVTLEDNCHIHRARKNIQTLIRQHVGHFEGALIAFHYANPANRSWRLSYLEKRANNTDSTSAKRYTYLCGKDYPCRTIAERFALLATQEKNAKNVDAAFSVEALSDEFFNEYRKQYTIFCDYIVANRNDATKFGPEFATCEDKFIRDYVKKMMGRLTFLHFLQKKGWLGQPRSIEGWGEGNVNFMRDLFAKATEEQKDNFLDEILEPLFFDCLNDKREGDFFDTGVPGIRIVKIPYLNGGLFEKDEIDAPRSQFPKEMFQNLLDFYGQFNFTIDESDPLDTEVGVDPEMLGKIFENLLEDNKDKGAFYTPKEIVQYMCKESLIAYLVSESQKKNEASKQSQAHFEDAIRAFVNDPEMNVTRIGRYTDKQLTDLLESLQAVKICDPAIGSGAFPMGLLNLLVNCREALNKALGIGVPRAELKQHIILNNIYGVDIEKGAIDIARLRFWLSIVVDEDAPQPLPNFDYKFMQGNSLLEQFEGVDLSNMFETNTQNDGLLLITSEEEAQRGVLRESMNRYFTLGADGDKHQLRQKVNQAVLDLVKTKTPGKTDLHEKLAQLDISANDQFFLWHTWFADVFDKGGFDIVIGNPPYGASLSAAEKAFFRTHYTTAKTIKNVQKGSLDTYTLFIERGYNLLKTNGNLAYIVPISFTSSDSLTGVHKLLNDNCETLSVSSYAVRPEPVFKNAVVNTSIIMFRKTLTPCKALYSTKMHRKKGSDFNLQKLINSLQFTDVKQYQLIGRIPKIGTELEKQILNKIFKQTAIRDLLSPNGKCIYYRFAGGRYFKVVTNYSTKSSAEQSLSLVEKYADIVGCCLSSNLSFWFYQIFSDNLNWKSYEIGSFTIPIKSLSDDKIAKLETLYQIYLDDIERNANVRYSSGESTYNVSSFKEYKIGKSKSIIDQIDDIICPLYGLTKEETEFVKNYELAFRLSDE